MPVLPKHGSGYQKANRKRPGKVPGCPTVKKGTVRLGQMAAGRTFLN
jgi:hypothetical protein